MNILSIGATAAISQATCLALAKEVPSSFYLIGRNVEKLEVLKKQLEAIRPGCVVAARSADLRNLESIPLLIEDAHAALGTIDAALIGHGTLLHRDECADDLGKLRQIVEENFTSEVVCVNQLLRVIERKGIIAVVTSVAGDAARPSSAMYSATKAALSRYLQGIRGTAWERGVRVIDVRPGWVDTPMTKNVKGKFWVVRPETVGRDISRAIVKRKPEVLYTPWFWRWIMGVIKLLPTALHKRMAK